MAVRQSTQQARTVTRVAVGLSRASTSAQDQSVVSQREDFERYCQEDRRKLLEVFEDDGVSGSMVGDRDGVRALLSYLRKIKEKGQVLVRARDRLARAEDVREAVALELEIEQTGWKLIYLDEPGTGDPLADALLGLLRHFQAGDFLRKLPVGTLRGQLKRALAGGMLVGVVPFGLARSVRGITGAERIVPRGARFRRAPKETVRLVPGESAEVETVRWIYEQYASGNLSVMAIVELLNRRGVPGPRGALWKRSTAKTILENPAYAGDFAWNRKTSGKFCRLIDGTPQSKAKKAETRNQRNAAEDVVLIRDYYSPALIERENWDKAQEVAKQRGRAQGGARRSKAKTHPLSGLVFCGKCGGRMSVTRWDKRGSVYACSTYRKARACESYSIRASELESGALYRLKQVFEEFRGPLRNSVLQVLRETLGVGGTTDADLDRRRQDVERLRRRVDLGLENLTLLAGDAATLMAEKVGALSKQLGVAAEELARAEERRVRDADLEIAADEVMALLDRVNEIGLDAPPEERREVLEACLVGVDLEFATEQRGKLRKHKFLGGDLRIPEPLALAAATLLGVRSLVRDPG